MTEIANPPAAAADLILSPVALVAVDASTLKAGFVAPLSPTARAFADADVIVCAVLLNVLLMATVPVTASALPPMVAPPRASEVAAATPRTGVTSVGDVEKTRLVEVVPVVPAAESPVILLKQVMLALEQFVPPLAAAKTVPDQFALFIVTVEISAPAVTPAAGTAAAVIDELHWNPAALSHSRALPAA
jgi:hypothetical protein